MKRRVIKRPLRTVLAMALLVTGVAAFWSGTLILSVWDDLWNPSTYQGSYRSFSLLEHRTLQLESILQLERQAEINGPLTYSQNRSLENMREQLEPENTNFRFQIHDSRGNLLMDNLGGAPLETALVRTYAYDFNLKPAISFEQDDVYTAYLDDIPYETLCVATKEGVRMFDPRRMAGEELAAANAYGWFWLPEDLETLMGQWTYEASKDLREAERLSGTIEYGLPATLAVEDEFSIAAENYTNLISTAWALLPVFGVTVVVFAALFAELMRSAGYHDGLSPVTVRTRDRWWYELYLFASMSALSLALSLGDSIAYSFSFAGYSMAAIASIGVFSLFVAWVGYLTAETAAIRLRAHIFWQTTMCLWLWKRGWLLLRFCWRPIRRGMGTVCRTLLGIPLYGRVITLFLLHFLASGLIRRDALLCLLYQGAVLFLICLWVRQWRAIREAAGQIAAGKVDCQISTKNMFPDLREHAEQLNGLSDGLTHAVNERMKSEHFKSELITNVSHDLKTPLTSIINYVDLLKQTDIQDPRALEYIEVLDRKSQRLKKLTEDLVEASKASTGNLTVNRERLNVGQLADQALAEYGDRLAAASLTPVLAMPEKPAYISADGRHLWRVIDNLLSNCCKYAMPGTRVYLDIFCWESQVGLMVKNISREALNIPAESLMERFVRGDASRTTEGSGLGLSIARSLTELQGGGFSLSIDGDLFKATVTFPEAPEPPGLESPFPERM